MDLQALTTTLSSYGTVDFCNYNGGNTNQLIVVIQGFTSNVTNINAFNATAVSNIEPEFPTLEHFALNENILKVVYAK